jgi:hypothetical protein
MFNGKLAIFRCFQHSGWLSNKLGICRGEGNPQLKCLQMEIECHWQEGEKRGAYMGSSHVLLFTSHALKRQGFAIITRGSEFSQSD